MIIPVMCPECANPMIIAVMALVGDEYHNDPGPHPTNLNDQEVKVRHGTHVSVCPGCGHLLSRAEEQRLIEQVEETREESPPLSDRETMGDARLYVVKGDVYLTVPDPHEDKGITIIIPGDRFICDFTEATQFVREQLEKEAKRE